MFGVIFIVIGVLFVAIGVASFVLAREAARLHRGPDKTYHLYFLYEPPGVPQADRRRASADLLDGHDMLQIAKPGAAILLFDGDAVQAELAHLGPQVTGEFVAAVDLVGDRRDPVGGEAAYRVAQHVRGVAEIVIEREVGHPTSHQPGDRRRRGRGCPRRHAGVQVAVVHVALRSTAISAIARRIIVATASRR